MVPQSSPPAQDAATHPEWLHRPAQALTLPPGAVPGTPQPLLRGVRFAVKDNIDVAGWPTTAACPAFAYTARQHATVVQRLLDHGAALVGKTNLDQFACGLSGTRSPYGAVPNAVNPSYVSGGSSSGSAYAVATGQVDLALGTDTAGSGRVPAGLNNIVGLKPSKGLLSAAGVVPAAQSVDCVSIFAPTVAMAVRALRAALGHDPQDPYSRRLELAQTPWPPSVRVGVPGTLEFFGDALAEAAFKDALQRVRALGAEVVTLDFSPLYAAADMLYGSALVAQRYAAVQPFFDAHPEAFIEPVRSIIGAGQGYTAADLVHAQTRLAALAQQAAPLWKAADVLLVPTAPTHVRTADMLEQPVELNRRLGAYTNFVNLLDYAALSVPSSLRPDGLPFGITFIGPCGSDLQLAELGQRYHHATGLPQGATGRPLPAPEPILPAPSAHTVRVAVVGAHLSGMPLNHQLTERGATLAGTAHTSNAYRLFALPGTTPPKPGLVRTQPGQGGPIELEIWEMPVAAYGSFVALIPPPLGIGTLELADGSTVQGFLAEAVALQDAQDITALGGWRAYMRQLKAALHAVAD